MEVAAAMDASSSRELLSVIASRFADPGTVVFDMIAYHRGTSVTVAEQEMGEVKLKLGKRGEWSIWTYRLRDFAAMLWI